MPVEAMIRVLAIVLLAGILPFGLASAQQQVSGKARVLDGDTLEVGGMAVRLYGLIAPPAQQQCLLQGRTWPCGWEAQMALVNLTAYQWMVCDLVAMGSDGLPLAVCALGGKGGPDLGARLLAEGWGTAVAETPATYRGIIDQARAAQVGLWRGGIQAWPQ